MEKSFEASTYNNSGIPVFSSLIPHILRNDVHEAFTSEFLAIRNITMAEYRGSGLFVEVQSCWDDPQKKDCQMWENCRGSVRNKENEENEEKEVEEDPCKGEEMTTLVMDEISNTFKVHEGRSYRLQVDDSVFPVSKSVRWRTGTVTVPQYDFTKSCLRQKRAVLPNGKHLVLMKLTKKDLQLRIEAKLSMGQKLVAKFSDADARIKETKGVVSVIIWGSVILVCICLLGAFVALMHRLRVHRTQKNLETQRPMEREQTVTEKA